MEWAEADRILLIEPFYAGSHKQWADAIVAHYGDKVKLLSLPGRHWKWRMHAASIELSKQFLSSDCSPDLVIASDMMDLGLFVALTHNRLKGIPLHLYMHENQLTYPWSDTDEDVQLKRDQHYAFVNYTSALVADKVLFNSQYHHDSFLGALPAFLQFFPDHQGLENVEEIRLKSSVRYMKLNLGDLLEGERKKNDVPYILWNHRWEYDKNPDTFFKVLFQLSDAGLEFKLIVCGKEYGSAPPIFDAAKTRLAKHIVHWGHADSLEAYHKLLLQSDILAVSSNQDFFGISIVEAIAAGAQPLLPRRLAYPELVSEEYLYDEGDLLVRLQNLIRAFPFSSTSGQPRRSCQRFSY